MCNTIVHVLVQVINIAVKWFGCVPVLRVVDGCQMRWRWLFSAILFLLWPRCMNHIQRKLEIGFWWYSSYNEWLPCHGVELPKLCVVICMHLLKTYARVSCVVFDMCVCVCVTASHFDNWCLIWCNGLQQLRWKKSSWSDYFGLWTVVSLFIHSSPLSQFYMTVIGSGNVHG